MKKNTYLSLALTICLGVISLPILADTQPTAEEPVNGAVPASQMDVVATLKEKAAYHKAMAEHYRSLIAAEYEKGGHAELKRQLEALSNEAQKGKTK